METVFNFECSYNSIETGDVLEVDSTDGTMWVIYIKQTGIGGERGLKLIIYQENHPEWQYCFDISVTFTDNSSKPLSFPIQIERFKTKCAFMLTGDSELSRNSRTESTWKKFLGTNIFNQILRFKVRIIREESLYEISVPCESDTSVDFRKQIHYLFLSGNFFDVVEGDGPFRLHRCILSARSTYFLNLIKDELHNNPFRPIRIESLEAEMNSRIWHYIYAGRILPMDSEVTFNLGICAKVYNIPELFSMCMQFLKPTISNTTVCNLLILSHMEGMTELKKACIDFLNENLIQVQQLDPLWPQVNSMWSELFRNDY